MCAVCGSAFPEYEDEVVREEWKLFACCDACGQLTQIDRLPLTPENASVLRI